MIDSQMQPATLNPRRGRFLHLIPDDKFIDAAHGIFEEASPGNHDFLLLDRPPLRFIHAFVPACMEIDRALEDSFLSTLPRYSAVFVHYLSDAARCIIASAPDETRFVWLAWGGDYYHLIRSHDALLLPKTRAIAAKRVTPGTRLREGFGRLRRWRHLLASPAGVAILLRIYRILQRAGMNKPEELALIDRITAISTPIAEDFEAIRSRHPDLRASRLDWNYWTEGFDAGPPPSSRTKDGHNVLLGNSASPENNHIDALDLLSTCLPDGWRIYCPLSYGDETYGDTVERHGKALFADRFIALRDYMPSESYRRIVASCSVVVMNHIRQQALGNIIISLHAGSHVFLNDASPIHGAMQRIGIDIGTLDTLPGLFPELANRKQDHTTTEVTRRKIESAYGRTSILRRTRKILADLDQATAGPESANRT